MGTEQCFDSTGQIEFEKRKMMDDEEILRFSDYREFERKKVAYHAVWQRKDAAFLEMTIDAIEPLTSSEPGWFVSPPAAEHVTWCDVPTPPKPIRTPDPPYPPTARSDRIQGSVELFMSLGADGKQKNVTVLRSVRKDLDDQAAAVVPQWQFKPAMCGAVPMPWELRVEINFHLY
jgi:TonB family protein